MIVLCKITLILTLIINVSILTMSIILFFHAEIKPSLCMHALMTIKLKILIIIIGKMICMHENIIISKIMSCRMTWSNISPIILHTCSKAMN